MSAISGPAAGSFLSLLLAASALPAQTIATASPSAGMSKVRIVRMSEVMGAVEMDLGVGRGFEPAIENLPVVESTRIRTEAGVAEIEFEDDSTLRVASNTEVEFRELERTASGTPVTEVRVVRGMAYVSLLKTRDREFTLMFGPRNNPDELRLPPSSHVRLEVNATGAQLAVLGGTVQVNGADGLMTIPHKRTISFSFARRNDPTVTGHVAAKSLDAWDRQSADYHAQVATLSAFGNAPGSYGEKDMTYYGSFSDIGSCGMMWRPYFASAAWSPYADGVWAWYGSAGYSWVSPYPWGWMPYHYGSWSFCPGNGWGWMPGGTWNGLSNVPAVTQGIAHRTFPLLPRPPAHPPGSGGVTLTAVTTSPLFVSDVHKGSFVFRRDSAGLGIPRQGLGNLRSFSRAALRHGTVTTPVYLSLDAGRSAMGGGSRMGAAGQLAPVMVHRGFDPAMASDSGFFPGNRVGSVSPGMPAGNQPAVMSTMSAGPAMGAGAPRGGGRAGATGATPR
ncbi:MAG TPA: DUF6600 domain-containing protein [Acidobacteriaceae bacterium]|nr:DUF6600 domain-containing protein [Acidobacteriaceae bacterium]